MSLPLTEKYRPEHGDQIQGHDKAVDEVRDFITNYKSQKKHAVLLHGQAGTGKTSTAHALASELGMELVEVNGERA